MLLPVIAASGTHGSPTVSAVLLSLALVVVGAKLAGELVERMRLPAVVGELMLGILLGNLAPFGGPDVSAVGEGDVFVVLAELGAVLLLFQVGLESRLGELAAVGGQATLVALVGVVTPMLLGCAVGMILEPHASWMLHAFLGAMLTATSVGITARVLQDSGSLKAPFARIILGAAVIDDVLGLLLLAVVAGLIADAQAGSQLGVISITSIVGKALVFLLGSVLVGSIISPQLFRTALRLRSRGVVQTLSLGLCFALAFLAGQAGLAPIVGAFAAGLVLEEVHFEGQVRRGERPLHESLEPLIALLVPVFFVRMGMLVDLRSFAEASVAVLAAGLTVAAVAGKLASAMVVPRALSPLAVALGMMPRGEVGLIFAGMGTKLLLGGRPLVDTGVYAAAVLMVMVTTLATPPALTWAIRRSRVARA